MVIVATLGMYLIPTVHLGFPGGSGIKNLPASAGDTDSVPDLGRFYMP